LSRAATETLNIASHLSAMARSRPFAAAVVCPAGRDRAGRARFVQWTYRALDQESNELAWELTRLGVGRGIRTVLMVKPSLEFFAWTFALFKAGAVPVLIDPGMGIKNLGQCLAEARPEAFVGIPRAQLARRLLGWGKATIHTALTVYPGRYRIVLRPQTLEGSPGEAVFDPDQFEMARLPADETAAILFTSGSTGVPKGVVYTHAIFEAQVASLRALYGIEPGEVDLCTFPLFALFAPALGMTSIVPEMDATRPARVDPVKIIEAIETFGVTNMFGSPALIRRVGSFGAARGVTLPTLRRVISAGAPVPARVIETFSTMLGPDARIFTPYGATEALPVASISSVEILGETRFQTDRGAGICVGRPVDGVTARIIGITDDPIAAWSDDLVVADGEIGEIVVSGPVVTREYFNRPESNRLAKIVDPLTGIVWHRMGDLGYRDEAGRIWFCGRKAHRVVTPSGTLYTIPCEAVFNTHPEVSRTALVGVGARPVLCVEPLAWPRSKAEKERIRRELLGIGASQPHTREIKTILFHRAFPVDIRHNAKIFREKLAVWAARALR
jgi:acyl-CoA synthetase (AMP-forming)/AMP-acid ligase II